MDETIRRYILGDVDEALRANIEERLLVDAPFFDLVMCEFDELADDYAHELLPARELETFESIFLSSPELYHRVSISKAIKRYVSTNDESLVVERSAMPVSNISKLNIWLQSLRPWRTKGPVSSQTAL